MMVAGLVGMMGLGMVSGCASHGHNTNAFEGQKLDNILVGTWLGESSAVTAKWGYEKGPRTLVIKDQQGTEFRGECTWTFKSDGPLKDREGLISSYDAGTGTVRMTRIVVGTINPTTGKLVIAQQDATGTITGRLVDKDTLELVFADSGSWARVFSAKLTRQGAAARK